MNRSFLLIFFLLGDLLLNQSISAQRTQLPGFLSRTYLSVNIGYINYRYSQVPLEPGFQASTVHVPHVGVSLAVLGHRFNEHLSTQVVYLRPVNWVQYKNVNGDNSFHSIFLNFLGLTTKADLSLTKKMSGYLEAGPALLTRLSTLKKDSTILKGATYLTLLAGFGLEYIITPRWKLRLGMIYSPSDKKSKQPTTTLVSGGITYSAHPLPETVVQRNLKSGYIFPLNLIQLSITSNTAGYGVNRFFGEGAVPIFWTGDVRISRGITVQYQRNIFHGRKLFSLDWSSSISMWTSKDSKEQFVTFSVFPLLRFTLLHLKPFDFYFNYSAAGPTYLSKVVIDNRNTGKHFTFQDFMGVGIYTGRNRNINAELKIQHYSNGNIFTANPGLQIPLSLSIGYAFTNRN